MGLGSAEDPLPGLQIAAFLLHLPVAERERSKLSHVSPQRAMIPFTRVPRSPPGHPPKAPSPQTVILGIGFQHMNLGETQTLSP